MIYRGLRRVETRIFGQTQAREPNTGTRIVIPYFHSVSHNLLGIARRFGINLVFKNNFRLDALTPFQKHDDGCKNHKNKYVHCTSGIVYKIPLACGFCYIGQSKRCLNDRLREHALKVKKDFSSELVKHLDVCKGCTPLWNETVVKARESDLNRRLLRETLAIQSHGNCVSKPSVLL